MENRHRYRKLPERFKKASNHCKTVLSKAGRFRGFQQRSTEPVHRRQSISLFT